MNLSEIEKCVHVVQCTMNSWVRNDYERKNLITGNLHRLKEAQTALSKYDGDYATNLQKRIDLLEKSILEEANKHNTEKKNSPAFKIDFLDEAHVDEEINQVEESLKKVEKEKAERKKLSRRGAPGTRKKIKSLLAEEEDEDDEDKRTEIPKVDLNKKLVENEMGEISKSELPSSLYSLRAREISRVMKASTLDIPEEIVKKSGTAYPEENTPLCNVEFNAFTENNFQSCRLSITLPKCIFLAGLFGKPLTSPNEVILGISAKNESSCSVQSSIPGEEGGERKNVWSSADEDDGQEKEEEGDSEHGESFDCSPEEDGDDSLEKEMKILSKQLVQEYHEAERLAEVEEASRSNVFPISFSANSCTWIRGAANAMWAILLCHGGYFAGGIFFNNQCVAHKTFQRYVVRKKQGGKQSNAQKDGGSFGSIGSQIRAAQEVKWRIDVRDTLLKWKPFLDASFVILYAAPGPSNRSVLTNFSAVPREGAKGDGASPVNLRDPRVHKVPITSHRPTFWEVERIFAEVSVCNIVYFQ